METLTRNMTVEEIIARVEAICRKNRVEHLSLFGSYARGTQTRGSDIDFVVYGAEDIESLREQVDEIETLKKIDLFDYNEVCSQNLREDMDDYGKKIY